MNSDTTSVLDTSATIGPVDNLAGTTKPNPQRSTSEPYGNADETRSIRSADDDLVAQYGPPVMFNEKGDPTSVNQMFFAGKYARANLILLEPMLNQYFVFVPETGLWQTRSEARIIVELGVALSDMLNECGASSLLKSRTVTLLRQILQMLKGMVERSDAFRRTKSIIHVRNGVLHLDDPQRTLHEFSPEYFSRNRTEIEFVDGAACPRFLNALLQPALSRQDISLLQRYAGQCLLGVNLSQKILLLRGTAGGGKSTLVNILELIIGLHNVAQLRVQHLAERFEIAALVGKTLLCGKDVPGDFLNNPSAHMLKSLVGGDRMQAEQKNVKHRFEMLGEFNVIVTSNTHLHVRLDADSAAWRRRLLIIDYEMPPTDKPIPQFDRQLVAAEGPGILSWCIAGARQLLTELETHGKVQMTVEQANRVEALLSESDSVRHFVSKMVIKDHRADVTVHELSIAYRNFCDGQGWQAVTVRQFENRVSDLMMEVHRVPKRTDIQRNDKNQRGFAQVRLESKRIATTQKLLHKRYNAE